MMTSRAEYRMLLRMDNAHLRLTEKGRAVGLVDDRRWEVFCELRDAVSRELVRLERTSVGPTMASVQEGLRRLGTSELRSGASAAQLLRRPEVHYGDLVAMGLAGGALPPEVVEEVETLVKYEGYIAQEAEQVARMRKLESRRIPEAMDFQAIRGLSMEAREKLSAIRPETLGQASRISGVSPADIAVLLVALEQAQAAKKGDAHG